MNAALQQGDHETFWFGMDAGLGALGNLSKIFFPPGTRSQAQRRGRQLRAAFGVGDDSLLPNRALRDAYEHFDERIDRWFRQSPRRNFADRLIGPAGMIQGIDSGDMFRHFNLDTRAVSVIGDELDLQALIDEVQKLVAGSRNDTRSSGGIAHPMGREISPASRVERLGGPGRGEKTSA